MIKFYFSSDHQYKKYKLFIVFFVDDILNKKCCVIFAIIQSTLFIHFIIQNIILMWINTSLTLKETISNINFVFHRYSYSNYIDSWKCIFIIFNYSYWESNDCRDCFVHHKKHPNTNFGKTKIDVVIVLANANILNNTWSEISKASHQDNHDVVQEGFHQGERTTRTEDGPKGDDLYFEEDL